MADTKRVREILRSFGEKHNPELAKNVDGFDDQTCIDSLKYLAARARQFTDAERDEARAEIAAVASIDRRAGR